MSMVSVLIMGMTTRHMPLGLLTGRLLAGTLPLWRGRKAQIVNCLQLGFRLSVSMAMLNSDVVQQVSKAPRRLLVRADWTTPSDAHPMLHSKMVISSMPVMAFKDESWAKSALVIWLPVSSVLACHNVRQSLVNLHCEKTKF